MNSYALKKSLSLFLHACKVYKNKHDLLNEDDCKNFKNHLERLQKFITEKNRKAASNEAKELEKFLKRHFPLSNLTKFIQSFAMLGVALFFAIIIRQTCFEFMEIPSGSMRPTFRECDRLVISKAQFGINIPLTTKHLFFNPEQVKRMNTIVLTSEGMDVPNNRINYFNIFPGYKQFIKRMIGLPEDTLYFYGGKIYGIDKDGNDISESLQPEILSHIEHIPYIHVGGRDKVEMERNKAVVTVKQNHTPIATLKQKNLKEAEGQMLVDRIEDVYNLWGMENYAMAKIIPAENLYFSKKTVDLLMKNADAKYYLEITHHPSIKNAKMSFDYRGMNKPSLGTERSFIPLNEKSLRKIWDNLYTSRFESNKGYLQSFGKTYTSSHMLNDRPKIKGHVPDGTYEFFDGQAYLVKYQRNPFSMIPSLALPEKVENDHPYANFSENKCVTLFNMGIEQSRFYVTHSHMGVAPSRYAYFRDGDFYLMGKKIFDKDSEIIKEFNTSEEDRHFEDASYTPFIDQGPPLLSDGSLDVGKIKKYGLHVPPKSYYVLGDNHAQSGDSREFGFVPEDNLRGTASMMLWAPGDRSIAPLQVGNDLFTPYKVIVWFLVLIGVALYYARQSRKFHLVESMPLSKFTEQPSTLIDQILVR